MSRAAAIALACGCALVACAGPGSDGRLESGLARPNVVLISIDTLRSDRLPAYGYDGVDTPAIDRLAADGVLFERAFTHVNVTLPSHVSLFSGLLPPQHGVRDNVGYRLGDAVPTLASELGRHGYATGGFVSSAPGSESRSMPNSRTWRRRSTGYWGSKLQRAWSARACWISKRCLWEPFRGRSCPRASIRGFTSVGAIWPRSSKATCTSSIRRTPSCFASSRIPASERT